MPKYSLERKESVLSKLLPPNNYSIAALSRLEGISAKTLYAWRDKARHTGVLMPNKKSPEHWDSRTKFTVVLETATLNTNELSAFCRRKGLYPEQVSRWRDACMTGINEPAVSHQDTRIEVRNLKKDKKELERQLRRKDKALAEAAALLVLQKKYQALWEDEE